MCITVRNLSYRAVESDLRGLFARHGAVVGVTLSRGSGLIEMGDRRGARAAVRALQGHRIHGRAIILSEGEPSGSYLMDVQEEYADTAR